VESPPFNKRQNYHPPLQMPPRAQGNRAVDHISRQLNRRENSQAGARALAFSF
jgi:hypothetical protein